jgi:rare lipoprotein A (peptidoglycan hydrolase)
MARAARQIGMAGAGEMAIRVAAIGASHLIQKHREENPGPAKYTVAQSRPIAPNRTHRRAGEALASRRVPFRRLSLPCHTSLVFLVFPASPDTSIRPPYPSIFG